VRKVFSEWAALKDTKLFASQFEMLVLSVKNKRKQPKLYEQCRVWARRTQGVYCCIIAFPPLLAKGAIPKQVFYVTVWECLYLGKCRFLCWILLSYTNYLLLVNKTSVSRKLVSLDTLFRSPNMCKQIIMFFEVGIRSFIAMGNT
jgi:hypothetical protein